jgi:hypothetical protein
VALAACLRLSPKPSPAGFGAASPKRASSTQVREAGTMMDPVYAVVKAGSTTYCALFLGQAQDIDTVLYFF